MKTVVGLLLVGTLSSLTAGCAHDPHRPKATVAAIGNPDPNSKTSRRGEKRGVELWVSERAALNHTAAAIEHENEYGQPNMAIAPCFKLERREILRPITEKPQTERGP